jgi:predicted amidohydrolase YtcJ
MKKLIYLATILLTLNACIMKEKADLIITNAKIYTVNQDFEIGESMAIKDGKIIALGSQKEILSKYESKNTLNLEGKFVYPGFIDPHCHFLGYGIYKQKVNLNGTKSFDEVIDKVIEFSKTNTSEWIVGRGWDQNDWPEKAFPTNEKLDSLFPGTPVMLIRIDGHAALVNSKALELAEITDETIIPGGDIIKKDGKITGVLIDEAADKVKELAGNYSEKDLRKALAIAQEDCFAVGLTTVSDAGLDLDEVRTIMKMNESKELKMRIYAMLNPTEENLDFVRTNGIYKTTQLNIRSIKLYADGALGSRGAAMLEPYSDDPDNFGLLLHDKEYFEKYCMFATRVDYQICTHAIGDSASHFLVEMYAQYLKPKNDKRWRIEHAQTVNPMDYEEMRDYHIIPSVQSTHATSDMYWAEERLGPERIKYAYAYKDLLELNGWIPNGSDFPIESINPLFGFYAAVARKDQEGYPKNGFQKENALSREEALKAMTIWAAKSNFEENDKGSLEVGKLADFVILEKDIMNEAEENLFKIKVLKTYLGGEMVYEQNATH